MKNLTKHHDAGGFRPCMLDDTSGGAIEVDYNVRNSEHTIVSMSHYGKENSSAFVDSVVVVPIQGENGPNRNHSMKQKLESHSRSRNEGNRSRSRRQHRSLSTNGRKKDRVTDSGFDRPGRIALPRCPSDIPDARKFSRGRNMSISSNSNSNSRGRSFAPRSLSRIRDLSPFRLVSSKCFSGEKLNGLSSRKIKI